LIRQGNVVYLRAFDSACDDLRKGDYHTLIIILTLPISENMVCIVAFRADRSIKTAKAI
jgi:hypothetical protein